MPTPFSHLQIAHRLLHDTALSDYTRQLITTHQADFLLGGIVADARPEGMKRADTHFYHYTEPMPDNPWREMLRQHPDLHRPKTEKHHAFVAGYVAHLAVDEYWSLNMLKPHFAESDWSDDRMFRFFVLHLLLIYMDERDEALLDDTMPAILRRCEPESWLPFLPDDAIRDWREYIAKQLETQSETLNVFGARIGKTAEELRPILDDKDTLQECVWDNIKPEILAHIEGKMYIFAAQQLEIYMGL